MELFISEDRQMHILLSESEYSATRTAEVSIITLRSERMLPQQKHPGRVGDARKEPPNMRCPTT